MALKRFDLDDHAQREEDLSNAVTIDSTHIIIQIPGDHLDSEYEISLEACKSAEQLVGWIFQLSEKSWVTKDLLRRFIEVVSYRLRITL
jgi:hypothetical protein